MTSLIAAAVAFLLTYIFAPVVLRVAKKLAIVDDPAIDSSRRVHERPVPLLGGVAIWLSITIVILWFTLVDPALVAKFITTKHIWGILFGSFILMVGGYLDDKYKLPLAGKILFPLAAAVAVVASGIGVNFITNPFGGVWRIDQLKIELFTFNYIPYYFNVGADLFTVFWLMLLMYTTKLLDGLDGLVTGITVIGAATIFFLSLTVAVLQFDTALLAAIVVGAFLGFLPYNWSSARLFLGEGGSLLAGYFLGVMAIIAGGKMATTALVVGVPLLDLLWVVTRRLVRERKSPFAADRNHFHFRLLDSGFNVRQAVLLLYVLAAAFGAAALFLESKQKFYVLIALAVITVVSFALAESHQVNNLQDK